MLCFFLYIWDRKRRLIDLFGLLRILLGRWCLLVDTDVEHDEQHQVTGQDQTSGAGSKWGSITGTHVWNPDAPLTRVLVGVEGVCGGIDKDQVQDELNDLESGDPLLPPDSDASGSEEIVPVHDDVDTQVQQDWDP